MSTISRYVVVDTDDTEGDREYVTLDEAIEWARPLGAAVIERVYAYDDSSLVWTPDGSDTWPPPQAQEPA